MDADVRARTLARFEEHRRAWDTNPALRALYGEWYGRVAAGLPPAAPGARRGVGPGPRLRAPVHPRPRAHRSRQGAVARPRGERGGAALWRRKPGRARAL